jgi:hypothetical protein
MGTECESKFRKLTSEERHGWELSEMEEYFSACLVSKLSRIA